MPYDMNQDMPPMTDGEREILRRLGSMSEGERNALMQRALMPGLGAVSEREGMLNAPRDVPPQNNALAWLMHIIQGGTPSRDISVPPPAAPGPGMLGPVNGAFPSQRPDYPLPTPSVGVRG